MSEKSVRHSKIVQKAEGVQVWEVSLYFKNNRGTQKQNINTFTFINLLGERDYILAVNDHSTISPRIYSILKIIVVNSQ